MIPKGTDLLNTKYDLQEKLRTETDTKTVKRYRKSQYKKLKSSKRKKYTTEQVFISINNRDNTNIDVEDAEIIIMNKETLQALLIMTSTMETEDVVEVVESL